jgi:hypothetical protein
MADPAGWGNARKMNRLENEMMNERKPVHVSWIRSWLVKPDRFHFRVGLLLGKPIVRIGYFLLWVE